MMVCPKCGKKRLEYVIDKNDLHGFVCGFCRFATEEMELDDFYADDVDQALIERIYREEGPCD